MENGKFETRFRFLCPVCGKAEVDRLLRACFSCWRDMSSASRRKLQNTALTADWIEAHVRAG